MATAGTGVKGLVRKEVPRDTVGGLGAAALGTPPVLFPTAARGETGETGVSNRSSGFLAAS